MFAAFSGAFGRKPTILLALTLFTIGTIVCGSAHSIAALLVGRIIQGIGGGGLLTMTYVVIADLFFLAERPTAMTIISLVWLVGTAVGPVMGGGFTTGGLWVSIRDGF